MIYYFFNYKLLHGDKKTAFDKLENILIPKLKNSYTVCQSIANYYDSKHGTNFKVIKYEDYLRLNSNQNAVYRGGRSSSQKQWKQIRHGPQVLFFENGKKKSLTEYKDGKLDGDYKKWLQNGQLVYWREYEDNVINGKNYTNSESFKLLFRT